MMTVTTYRKGKSALDPEISIEKFHDTKTAFDNAQGHWKSDQFEMVNVTKRVPNSTRLSIVWLRQRSQEFEAEEIIVGKQGSIASPAFSDSDQDYLNSLLEADRYQIMLTDVLGCGALPHGTNLRKALKHVCDSNALDVFRLMGLKHAHFDGLSIVEGMARFYLSPI